MSSRNLIRFLHAYLGNNSDGDGERERDEDDGDNGGPDISLDYDEEEEFDEDDDDYDEDAYDEEDDEELSRNHNLLMYLGLRREHSNYKDPDVVDMSLEQTQEQERENLSNQDITAVIKEHLQTRGKLKSKLYDNYKLKKIQKKYSSNKKKKHYQTGNITSLLSMRENGIITPTNSSAKAELTNRFIPNKPQAHLARYAANAFCGQFSAQGSYYFTTCQDSLIRLYDMEQIDQFISSNDCPQVNPIKEIASLDMGWAVVDCHCSRQEDAIIYSSWSPYVHLTSTSPEDTTNRALNMEPDSGHFCPFSIRFSHSGKEILAGCSDFSLYLYDLESNQRTLQIKAHQNDINSVCFADETSDLFVSGSDDGLCKVWDRRTLRDNRPVGVFMGHIEGITCVAGLGDGRYFATNSKDQTLKLWDLRTMHNANLTHAKPKSYPNWDYRWQPCPTDLLSKQHKHDMSVFTFRGHSVLRTLIRCYFSPRETTGQRYLYTGSSDGKVFIYDILTGETVEQLVFHEGIVRDVSWHPHYPLLATASWDQLVTLWGPSEADTIKDVPDSPFNAHSLYSMF